MTCIFCSIAKGRVLAHKIYEDSRHIAILDIYPNTKGQALVIPKKHLGSYLFDATDKEYIELLKVAKKVANRIDKTLGAKRTFLVAEGMMVDHLHLKLYPVFTIKRKIAKKHIYSKYYDGYITTQLGPRAKEDELRKTAERIRRAK